MAMAITVLMAVKNEYVNDVDICKGTHDDEIDVCL